VALGDRHTGYLTRREIVAALALFPAPEHPLFLATAFQPQVGAGAGGRLGPMLEAFVAASTAG
jgi:hypothetical protein